MSAWHVLYTAFGLYQKPLFSDWYGEAKDLLKATSIGTCTIVAAAVPFEISFIDARFMLIFWISVNILSFCGRLVAKELLLRHYRQEEHGRKLLIIGANARSIELARKIEVERDLGWHLLGLVDDTTTHAPNFDASGYSLVASFEGVSDYLAENTVDEVLVCLPVKSRAEDMARVVSICEQQGIAVGILRDLFKWDPAKAVLRQFGDQPIIMVRPHGIDGTRAATKRATDIIISAALIILSSPVFLITSLLIKLTSAGPIFFAQERVGLNKKRFKMLKFRTMVVDAEQQQPALEQFNEATGPVFKIRSDPRITPIGKFLRKMSIDELPQLINVIKGDMSLVGPRPLPLRDYTGFSEDWHRRRVSVRPGITGLWQVNGRDHSSFDNWMKQDLDYIDHWSLRLDAQVMLKTIPAVLRGSGE
jgi:exopolysaccharide biosynthesis polyprenyl glycosylphosphotransferase